MLKLNRCGGSATTAPTLLVPMHLSSTINKNLICKVDCISSVIKLATKQIVLTCGARRRARYEDDDDQQQQDEDGINTDIAILEMYTQSARGEALLVRATIDDQDDEVEVVIFKGFSSCLSYGTSPDPSKSVLPSRAVIRSVDRIRGPFNPANIEYLEKDLTLQAFKSRLPFPTNN